MKGKSALKRCYKFLGEGVRGMLVHCTDRLALTFAPSQFEEGFCDIDLSLIGYLLFEPGVKELAVICAFLWGVAVGIS